MVERVEQQEEDDENTFKNISCFLLFLESGILARSHTQSLFILLKEVYADSKLGTAKSLFPD